MKDYQYLNDDAPRHYRDIKKDERERARRQRLHDKNDENVPRHNKKKGQHRERYRWDEQE